MKGKLFQLKPGAVLRIVGQPWLQVEIYRPERLRRALCGRVFTAALGGELATGSCADGSAKAIVSLLKYRGGVPFYRQGQIQEILGAPISPSEIWEMTEEVADAVQPVYAVLCKEVAEAELLHNDDTKAKMEKITAIPAEKTSSLKHLYGGKKGSFTTSFKAVLTAVTDGVIYPNLRTGYFKLSPTTLLRRLYFFSGNAWTKLLKSLRN